MPPSTVHGVPRLHSTQGPYSCKNGVAWEMGRPRTELSVSRALARIKLSDS